MSAGLRIIVPEPVYVSLEGPDEQDTRIETSVAIVGYVRVSTNEQNVVGQRQLLEAAGAERIFEDVGVSGRLASRPGLDAARDFLREGDTLAVYSLSRLGRSTRNVLELLHALEERGVAFRSLSEQLDTSGPMGRAMIAIIAALAQLEADLTRERTMIGLATARAAGRVGGRKPALTQAMVQVARTMADSGDGPTKIAAELGVSRATIYRALSAKVSS